MHHLLLFASSDWLWDPSGKWYVFWSGFGSDFAEFAIIGSLYTLYHHHRCTRCWRLAHHPVQGTIFKTCHKHATVADHQLLIKQHKAKYPKQHELLNG